MTPQKESARLAGRALPTSTHRATGERTLAIDADQIKRALSDPATVLRALGLLDGAKRQAAGYLIGCVWHAERTPSLSVRVGSDGTLAAHCFGCDAGGDVFALVAAASGLDVRRDFPRVIERAAEIAGNGSPRGYIPPACPPSARQRHRPPVESVGSLWARCSPVADDADLARALLARAIDPAIVSDRDLARGLPAAGELPPWARRDGRSWRDSGHRAILPLWNAAGELAGVHARTFDASPDGPKGLLPAAHSSAGLFLADPFARLILTTGTPGWYRSEAPTFIVCEGAPDFLTVACHFGAWEYAPAVLGVLSGSWSDALAERIPSGCRVVIRTHLDAAGLKYRDTIARSLYTRCAVFVEKPEGAHHG